MKIHATIVFLIILTTLIFAGLSAAIIHNFTLDGIILMIPGMAVMAFLSGVIGKSTYED